jgi:hypothetical protein
MDAQYIFQNRLRDDSLEQYVRKMLEIHDLVNIEELCRDSGCSKADIQFALDTLIQRREVERLRPLNYEHDDMDFFCLRVQRQARAGTSCNRWYSGLKRAARRLFDDAEENIEHHHLNNILTTS